MTDRNLYKRTGSYPNFSIGISHAVPVYYRIVIPSTALWVPGPQGRGAFAPPRRVAHRERGQLGGSTVGPRATGPGLPSAEGLSMALIRACENRLGV